MPRSKHRELAAWKEVQAWLLPCNNRDEATEIKVWHSLPAAVSHSVLSLSEILVLTLISRPFTAAKSSSGCHGSGSVADSRQSIHQLSLILTSSCEDADFRYKPRFEVEPSVNRPNIEASRIAVRPSCCNCKRATLACNDCKSIRSCRSALSVLLCRVSSVSALGE